MHLPWRLRRFLLWPYFFQRLYSPFLQLATYALHCRSIAQMLVQALDFLRQAVDILLFIRVLSFPDLSLIFILLHPDCKVCSLFQSELHFPTCKASPLWHCRLRWPCISVPGHRCCWLFWSFGLSFQFFRGAAYGGFVPRSLSLSLYLFFFYWPCEHPRALAGATSSGRTYGPRVQSTREAWIHNQTDFTCPLL